LVALRGFPGTNNHSKIIEGLIILFSCAELYYDAKVARSSKTPAFGHGQRFGTHMLINNDAPSPQAYNVPSTDFGDTKKGFIFGISREKYDKVVSSYSISIYL
jgi:hypothetical protein